VVCLVSRKAVAEHQQQPIAAQRVEELRSSPGEGSISPGSQSSGSERTDRERQRLQEQERRRREVVRRAGGGDKVTYVIRIRFGNANDNKMAVFLINDRNVT
jgi:hypothetical protein